MFKKHENEPYGNPSLRKDASASDKMKRKEIGKFYVDEKIVIKGNPPQHSPSAGPAKEPKAESIIKIKKKNEDGTEKTITLVVKQIKDSEQRKELEKTAKKLLDLFGEGDESDDDDYSGGLLY